MSGGDEKVSEDPEATDSHTKLSREDALPMDSAATLESAALVEEDELSFPEEINLALEDMPASTMQVSSVDRLVGTMVDGRYFVEHRIGEGGMGVVYACRHTIIDKRVAMKVLRSDMAKQREAAERFLNEARSASSIGNAHIIDISDYGRLFNGSAYFVMEFLDGLPLVDLADEQVPQDPARVMRIGIQLTDGLAAAHRAGIIHRDLKPDNVFLVRQGTVEEFVKILDFGIAKATAGTSKLTQAGQIFGTPHYMSPEQADGARVDRRTDIYALGVMLYELSTGKLPFDAENYMAVLAQHVHREPTPPSLIEGLELSLPDGLEQLILRCLKKSPPERFQSMEEVGEELKRILQTFESASPPELSTRARSRLSAMPGRRQKATPKPPPEQTSHLKLYISVAVAAALLSGSVAWLTRSPPVQVPAEATLLPVAPVEPPESMKGEKKPQFPKDDIARQPAPPEKPARALKEPAATPAAVEPMPESSPRQIPRPRNPKPSPQGDIGGDELPSPW